MAGPLIPSVFKEMFIPRNADSTHTQRKYAHIFLRGKFREMGRGPSGWRDLLLYVVIKMLLSGYWQRVP